MTHVHNPWLLNYVIYHALNIFIHVNENDMYENYNDLYYMHWESLS